MSDEKLERLLASVPTRSLPPEADRRIAQAIMEAEPRQVRRWWTRHIPLWQAAAACVAVCAATLVLGVSRPTPAPPGVGAPPAHRPPIRTSAPAVPLRVYSSDTSGWQLLHVSSLGESR